MGKSMQGIHGNWWGRVGNIVGRMSQGRTIYSIYQPNVHNPKTAAQVTARTKFGLVTHFLAGASAYIAKGFHGLDGYKYGNPYSAAVGYNCKINNIIIHNQQTNTDMVDYTLAVLSEGSVDLPYSPNATADGTTLSLTWADNSGMGNAETDDKVMVAVYNPTKNQWIFNTSLAERNERNGTFALPTAWTGDTVNVWMSMYRESNNEASKSSFLASLPL